MITNKHGVLYFAHPINVYNTELEKQLLAAIQAAFPNFKIENPNQPHYAEGYKRWKEQNGNGMAYYMTEVLPNCNICVFLAFRDGKIGAGVYAEAQTLGLWGCKVFEISINGDITEIDNVESIAMLERVLNVADTKARVYLDKQMKPY